MLTVETIAKIRRLYKVQGQSIRRITEQLLLDDNNLYRSQ